VEDRKLESAFLELTRDGASSPNLK